MTTGEERLMDVEQQPQQQKPLYPKRLTVHPLDWGFLVCCVFVVAGTLAVCLLLMTSTSSASSMTASQAWPQIGGDLTKVTWAHAVNSAEKLQQALDDDLIMMLEADVVLGKLSSDPSATFSIPVMAHPPDKESDISLQIFLRRVIDAGKKSNTTKGVKLDFKDIDVVEDSLKIISSLNKEIVFPLWLNADVLPSSTAESTRTPVDPERFLDLCLKYQSGRTLSLGWTKAEQYSPGDVDSMLDLLEGRGLTGVTFPVQAAPALASSEDLSRLLKGAGLDSTLTLWGHRGAQDKEVVEFVQKLGKDKVYMDLPPKSS